MNSGLKSGFEAAVSSGYSAAKARQGFLKGLLNGFGPTLGDNDKVQDFTIQQGVDMPSFAWLADYSAVSSAGNITAVVNQTNSGVSFSVGSDPAYSLDVNGIRGSAQFDSNDRIYNSSLLGGINSCTIMMLVKVTGPSNARILFSKYSSYTFPGTGDILIDCDADGTIRSQFYGASGFSIITANVTPNEWYLITAKYDLSQSKGIGSEQSFSINRVRQTNFTTQTFTASGSNFSSSACTFGNHAGAYQGGASVACGVIYPYSLNSSQQVRTENFLKRYYGLKF